MPKIFVIVGPKKEESHFNVGPSFGDNSTPTASADASLAALDVVFDTGVAGAASISLFSVDLDYDELVGAAGVGLEEIDLALDLTGAASFSADPQVEMVAAWPIKDTYVRADSLCPTDAGYGGADDIDIAETATSVYDAYIAWDIRAVPANATLLSGYIHIPAPSSVGGVDHSIGIFGIAAEDEGWDELTTKCSNRPPAVGAMLQKYGAIAGERLYTAMNADLLAYFQGRAGASSVTVLLQKVETTGSAVNHASRELAARDGTPPFELTLLYTVPR